MSTENNSMLVAFTGPPGVGKTTAARHLDSYIISELGEDVESRFREIRAVSMRQLLGWHGYGGESEIGELREYHEALRQQGEAQQVLGRLSLLKEGIFILDSLRNTDDADYFKNNLGGIIIGLVAEEPICKDRFMADKDDEKHFGALLVEEYPNVVAGEAECVKRARQMAWDQEAEEVRTSGITGCLDRADVVIETEHSPEVVADEVLQHIIKYSQELPIRTQ